MYCYNNSKIQRNKNTKPKLWRPNLSHTILSLYIKKKDCKCQHKGTSCTKKEGVRHITKFSLLNVKTTCSANKKLGIRCQLLITQTCTANTQSSLTLYSVHLACIHRQDTEASDKWKSNYVKWHLQMQIHLLSLLLLLLICDAVHNAMTSQQCNTYVYCMVVLHACIHEPLVRSQPKPTIVCSATKRPGSTEYGKPTLDLQVALYASSN